MTVQNTIRFLIWWHPPELFFSSVKLNFSERSLTHHRDISWPFVVKGVTGFLIGHTRGVWRGVELWKRDLCHCFFSRNIIILGSSSFPKRFKSNNGYGIENYKLQIQQYGPAIPLRSWNSQFRYLPETVCGSNFTIRWFPVETTHPIISWHAMRRNRVVLVVCYRMLIIFLNVRPTDHISQGGLWLEIRFKMKVCEWKMKIKTQHLRRGSEAFSYYALNDN